MRLRTPSFVRLVFDTYELWNAKFPFQHAAAIAFYTLFSMAPLAVILVTMIGVFFGDEAARGEIAWRVEGLIGAQAADAVEEAVRRSRLENAGILPTVFGAGALLFGATAVFAQMQRSLNQFWDVASKPSQSGILLFLVTRLLSLGLVLAMGFLLLISFVMSIAITALIQYAEHWIPIPPAVLATVDVVVSVSITTLLFGTIFKVLPDVRIEWPYVWTGAALTALLFSAGQYVISWYLTTTAPGSTYGAAGSLVVVLFWVYYSSLIILFGTAFTQVYMRRHGRPIVPKLTAVRVKLEVIEEHASGEIVRRDDAGGPGVTPA
jgi:membrane protein